MKRRESIVSKFREYLMLDLDQFLGEGEDHQREDRILTEMIDEFRRR
ncbi:hypothetical protein PM10SUCC1_19880 [Propionigenium maris DSM 9537]|uniref:Uncharacterized protein n=1 Tax=Propionigenium maris DSM 9537 TaxID=1123000 RepID=A0A9W6GMC9_9FUSO|nr:hypothetical protein [Propionigenium maris]GLI56474.1 hypothetical protein PM10SUCC1_19880 [Propionigenium maris DSM 9537]